MTYLNDVHGIILGGIQNYIKDECTYDKNNKLIQLGEPADSKTRLLSLGIMRSHGAHKIASYLREYGADVEVLDFSFAWTFEELKDIWKSRYHSKTFFIAISVTFRTSSLYIWQFVEWIRENYPHIHMIGGTQSIDKILPYCLDWYVYGYGEYGMLELIKNLKDKTSSSIKYHQVGDKKIINCQKNYKSFPKKKLSISYEDRDSIESWEVLPIEGSRGCIFQCAFCSYPILGVKDDHSRDEEDFYEELLENYEKWGTKHYLFADETVNDYHEKLERFASVIKRLPFKPRFGGYARGDIISGRKKSWDTYIELGFMAHFYGIESMHWPSAIAIGKGMEIGRLQDGLLEFKDYAQKNHDFYTGYISLIAGLPNETFETLDNTYDWLRKNWKDQFSIISPLGLSAPIFTGDEAHIGEEMENQSLIEKDPGKYGYEIVQKDYEPGAPMEWINNTGMTSTTASAWIVNKGFPLTYGSIPPWYAPEMLVDPDIDYLDMMIKSNKMKTIAKLSLRRGLINPAENIDHQEAEKMTGEEKEILFRLTTHYGREEKKKSSDDFKTPLLQKVLTSFDSQGVETVPTISLSSAEENNVVFSSGGKHYTENTQQHKINFISRYKIRKINA
tara:strand:+ start:25 stop:1875 length:1851 start_codon:yes stop_codon:yes gene_type:complete